MRRVLRTLTSTLLGLGLVVACLFFTQPAQALAPPVTLTGSAPTTATGPGTVGLTYLLRTTHPLTGVAFGTHQDAALPALAATVTVNGTAVDPATVTSTAGDLSFALGTAGALPAGTYRIVFRATVSATAALTSSSATVGYTDSADPGAAPVTAGPVAISVNEPDLVLIGGLSPDGSIITQPLGTGASGAAIFIVGNLAASPTAATLHVHVPAGLLLRNFSAVIADLNNPNDQGTVLSCPTTGAAGTTIDCPLGTLSQSQAVFAGGEVSTSGTPTIGSLATITADVAPDGALVDSDLSNNTTAYNFAFTGVADLTRSVTTSATTVTLGKSVSVTLKVHNNGPQPALTAAAFTLLKNGHFAITGFDGTPLDGNSGASGNGVSPLSATARRSALATARARLHAAERSGTGLHTAQLDALQSAVSRVHAALRLSGTSAATGTVSASPTATYVDGPAWDLGTIEPGQTKIAHLTLKAVSAGSDTVGMLALSDAADPGCLTLDDFGADAPNPKCVALLGLTAKKAVPVPSPQSGAHGELANTGGHPQVPAFFGGALVLIGSGALWLARRRPDSSTS
ncbi:LPXTG cell wall anchor domain-containing protein [Jatrophihabitans telluris]|uniref:LPXTG cell wall anchor domain-containing protein n=1 Tax=Jatrophihabitans telluris TaxID=2038343 RepID=A0ABY4QX67_9ACTN|nr:LPXTG cell wall anchor domain-containing protein [Jatrophihabitans telluris]UQX87787.1 LPXTG cell wall anchor domain-containing protein [Jatrophihabitans telluris]